MPKCIIICAPSGAGKTSITKYLLQQNLKLMFSVSACTREKRAGEENGKDYYFLTPQAFKQKIAANEFVEWEEVYTDQFYGTLKTEIERIWQQRNHVIFDVDVEGGLSLKNYFKENALTIFVKAPSIEILEARLRKRGTETEEKILKRLTKVEKEMSYADKFDVIIVNDVLENAQQKTQEVVSTFLKK
ncbi:MAG: guanylate kinase [Bacteroidetes bacterium HGW-Bacteroidetes-12]|jgi:guanylate kinase|nr:MAG: guanylate kinase [Bacteroidetes bacterium HGW-Bacteroidetes-12]